MKFLFPVLFSLCALLMAQDTISVEVSEPMEVCGGTRPASLGNCATPPKVLSSADPSYPEKARAAHHDGTVSLSIVVGTDGNSHDIRVTGSLGDGLDEAASAAVAQWKFEPGTYEGKPVPVRVNVTVNFRLSSSTASGPLPPNSTQQEAAKLYTQADEASKRRDYETAANLLRRVTALAPEHRNAWNMLGVTLLELNQLDAAADALQTQIKIDPGSLAAYNNLGRVYARQHRYEDAASQFQKQIAVNPQDPYAHVNLGLLLRDQKKCSEAVVELQKGLVIAPKNGFALLALGECDIDLGDKAKGLAEMEQATNIASTPVMWNSAAYGLAQRNLELDRAEKWALRAIAIESAQLADVSAEHISLAQWRLVNSISAYWDTLGWIYFQRGDYERARSYLSPSWLLRSSPSVGWHLAQAYEKLGIRDDAVRTYAMAIVSAGGMDTADDVESVTKATESLKRLMGPEGDANHYLAQARSDLITMRTISIPKKEGISGKADFGVTVASQQKVVKAFQLTGNKAFADFSESIKGVTVPDSFPPSTTLEIPRRGTLQCDGESKECRFNLFESREAAELANKEAAQESAVVAQVATPDSRNYESASLGMRVYLADQWRVVKEEPGSYSHSHTVFFGKPGTLAVMVLTREHLESPSDLYSKMLEANLSKFESFKRTGEMSVTRDGIKGARWNVNWDVQKVEYSGLIEFFSVGDDHYRVSAMAPTDVYSRYAQDFEDMLRSLRFPMARYDPKTLQGPSTPK